MSLLAYNLTAAPLALAAGTPIVTLPASASAGSRGVAQDVTAEVNALTAPGFAALQAQVALGYVQYEWSGLPEFNTYSLVVGSAQTDVSDLPIDLYVDAGVAGDDANPGTQSAPFKTFDRAWAAKPLTWKRSCRIHLAAGTYPVTGQIYYLSGGGPDGPLATPVAVIGENADLLGALTSIAGTVSDSVVATVNTTDGALRGAFYRNTTTGARSMIVNNTFLAGDTTFELAAPIGAAPGDQFVVERPASVLQIPTTNGMFFNGGQFIGWKNIKFEPAPGAVFAFVPLLFFVKGASPVFEACDVDLGFILRIMGCVDSGQIFAGASPIGWSADGPSNPFGTPNTESAGLYIHSQSFLFGILNFINYSRISGYAIIDGCLGSWGQGFSAQFNALHSINTSLAVFASPSFFVLAGKMVGGKNLGVDLAPISAIQSAVQLGYDAAGLPVGLEISNSLPTVPAVSLFLCTAQVNALTGTLNGTYGIVVDRSNVTRTVNTTVTGTAPGSDTLIGGVPKTYGALPFTDAASLSSIN